MCTRRTRPRELGMIVEQRGKRCGVAADDRVHRRFEVRDGRVAPRKCFNVSDKRGPAGETVASRHKELRVGHGAAGHTFLRLPGLVPFPFDSLYIPVDFLSNFEGDLVPLQAGKCFRPACGPVADCSRVAGVARVLKVLCELLVLLEIGTAWERKGVGHTNLLSSHAWSPHKSG